MNKLIAALITGFFLVGIQSQAFAASEKQLAQRAKMKSCNAEAKTNALKGADRKAFMKECLSADSVPAPAATPAAPAPAAAPAAK